MIRSDEQNALNRCRLLSSRLIGSFFRSVCFSLVQRCSYDPSKGRCAGVLRLREIMVVLPPHPPTEQTGANEGDYCFSTEKQGGNPPTGPLRTGRGVFVS